jgi:hypothetical protein
MAGFALNPFTTAASPAINAAITHLAVCLATRPTNRSPARVRR